MINIDASKCSQLKSIMAISFGSCLQLQSFTLGAVTPPELDCNMSPRIPNAVLKVPAESVDAYKNSDWAKYFKTIEAL